MMMMMMMMVLSLGKLNHKKQLQTLDISNLPERRQRVDMIQIFKIFHGRDNIEMGSNFSFQQN